MSDESEQPGQVNPDRIARFGHLRQGRLTEIDQAVEDMRYWLSRPMEDRYAALEKLREEAWPDYDETQPRLQRFSYVHIRKRS